MNDYHATPFALTTKELNEVMEFAKASGLDQIGRMAAELVALRAEFIALSARYSKLQVELQNRAPAEKKYAAELDSITGKC